MPCGCGKKRADRLAAKKAVTASAVKPNSNEPVPFAPARWPGHQAKEKTA